MAKEEKPELPDVPEERVERPAQNDLGRALKKIRGERMMALMSTKHKLFERHGITHENKNLYKIVEDRITMPNGSQVIELRLYQLIDGAKITIETEITSKVDGGILNLREFNDGRQQNSGDSN